MMKRRIVILGIIMMFSFITPSSGAAGSYDEQYDFRGDGYYYKTAEGFASGSGAEDDPYIITSNVKRDRIGIASVNYGAVEDCKINTRISMELTSNAGGIAGENYGAIRRCTVEGTTSEPGYSNIVGTTGIGGICGFNNGGIIEECYSGIKVRGEGLSARAVGGIAGDNTGGIIRNCLVGDAVIINNGSEAGGIAGRIGYGGGGEPEFTDADQIPSWAANPLTAAVSNKYISGYEDGSFRPDNTLTRAEAATILYKIKMK